MKMTKLKHWSLTVLFFIGCAGAKKFDIKNSNTDATRETPENKKLAQVLSLPNDKSLAPTVFVIDLSQQLGYLIETSGQIVENVAFEIGKTGLVNGKKVNHRPPTGIFSFEFGPENQIPVFRSILLKQPSKANTVLSFSPTLTDGNVQEVQCQKENCLVMKSKDLEKLSKYIGKQGLVTIILRKGEWLSEETHLEKNQKLERFMTAWEAAWESRDINQYMNLYGAEFTHPKFDREGWKKYKSNLFSTYQQIDISTGRKMILNFGPAFFVQFSQKFNSNSYSDAGIKTIIVSNEEIPQIIFEDWALLNQ